MLLRVLLLLSSSLCSLLLVTACGGGSSSCPEPAVTQTQTPNAAQSPTSKSASQAKPGIDVGSVTGNEDAVFRVQIEKSGALSIEGQHLGSPSELTERLRTSMKARPDLQVQIVGDRDATFSYVLNTIELVKQAGVSRIAFGFDKNPPTTPASAPARKSVPSLEVGSTWKCHIHDNIPDLDKKSAFVAIHVGPDGVAQTVDILEDPGSGLGEAAKACAFNQKFKAAVDDNGKPTAGILKLKIFFQH